MKAVSDMNRWSLRPRGIYQEKKGGRVGKGNNQIDAKEKKSRDTFCGGEKRSFRRYADKEAQYEVVENKFG